MENREMSRSNQYFIGKLILNFTFGISESGFQSDTHIHLQRSGHIGAANADEAIPIFPCHLDNFLFFKMHRERMNWNDLCFCAEFAAHSLTPKEIVYLSASTQARFNGAADEKSEMKDV